MANAILLALALVGSDKRRLNERKVRVLEGNFNILNDLVLHFAYHDLMLAKLSYILLFTVALVESLLSLSLLFLIFIAYNTVFFGENGRLIWTLLLRVQVGLFLG